uniref:Uncharacterized protein n=1 Tax=Colobus angolensis palliatus TaxID=336983 RepID=A0A2K5IKJ4_COLAP
MTVTAAAYTIALRYTRTSDKELYFSTTAVCITEVIKLLLSVGILHYNMPEQSLSITCIFSITYRISFLCLGTSDSASVTYQLKIPCTALCTVLMLNRTLSKLQWVSVFMLCAGVTLVQWKPAQATKVVVRNKIFKEFRYFSLGEKHSNVSIRDYCDISWRLLVRWS